MNVRRKCLAVILTLVMILSLSMPVFAGEHNDTEYYVRQIMNYYRCHQENATVDISCLVHELNEIDPRQAQAWSSIVDYWSYVNAEMIHYSDVLPDGLPNTDALCIVVLGYELNYDGSMKDELIGRLETALASAEKYPNAYIVCTGGGTARGNKNVTEAGQMARWLMEQGIGQERIIIENMSYSTVSNARNTCRILDADYPQITHLALITSDYHLPRASLLFHTQVALNSARSNAPERCIVANAAYSTSRGKTEGLEIQVSDMQQLTGISLDGMAVPELSQLSCIVVSGNAICQVGMELDLHVTAFYDTGLYRDVTSMAKFYGYDLTSTQTQAVTVTYEEGNTVVSEKVQIEMYAPETLPPTEPPTEPPTQPPTTPPTEPPVAGLVENDSAFWLFLAENWVTLLYCFIGLLAILELLIILRLRKLRREDKARKAAEDEAAKLASDDSPLEYI